MILTDAPILIVGAGPAGLTTAATLARAGVRPLVVDRRPAPSPLPRATSISTRSMEILRSFGVEDAVLAGGVDVDWVLWRCATLAQAAEGTGFEIGLPTAAQAALVSPTAPGCVPQDHLESVVEEHLRAVGVQVDRGVEVVGLDVHASGTAATLSDGRVVHARYVVAADGAYSFVRRTLGVEMRGPERLLDGITALFRAPLWELLGDLRFGIYGVGGEGGGVFLPAGPGDRWGFGYVHEPGAAAPSDARLAERIRGEIGVPDLPFELGQTGTFSAGVQLAERYRVGSAFLVGDAAHRVTPRGGTGMNTSIHDGHDLGWKLAWVLNGWAGEELLDSYEAERRPVAEHNLARSADPDGSVRDVHEELRVDLGGRLPHLWVDRGVSTLDVLGPGLTLFTGPDGAEPPRSAAPVEVVRLDELTARALGGTLLVRPDGVPARETALSAAA